MSSEFFQNFVHDGDDPNYTGEQCAASVAIPFITPVLPKIDREAERVCAKLHHLADAHEQLKALINFGNFCRDAGLNNAIITCREVADEYKKDYPNNLLAWNAADDCVIMIRSLLQPE